MGVVTAQFVLLIITKMLQQRKHLAKCYVLLHSARGPEGFSARCPGCAGTKVWLRRSGGKTTGRLKLKVRFVSELVCDYYRTREQEAVAKSAAPIVFLALSA